jgi:hypothetical protein
LSSSCAYNSLRTENSTLKYSLISLTVFAVERMKDKSEIAGSEEIDRENKQA